MPATTISVLFLGIAYAGRIKKQAPYWSQPRDIKRKRIVHRRGAMISAASFEDITGKTLNSTMSLQFAIH